MERREGPGRAARWAPWAAGLVLLAIGLHRYGAILRGLGSHFADFPALHGHFLFNELPDSRLNAWILGWVEHATTSDASVWNANTFHPAPNMLAGSEHLFGVLAQLLPALPFAPNAVALHQLALVLSSALLCATTWRAVSWATDSNWAAFIAAAFALLMPWRVTELGHLQLSSVQFIPLIWMGVVRGLLGEARNRDLVVLGLCTALQLLSSFYLAYFLTVSSAVLVAVVAVMVRPAWRHVARLGGAVAPAYALFGLTALPYLQRQASADLRALYEPGLSIDAGLAFSAIAPNWPYGWNVLNQPANYWTPWAVALLGLVALVGVARSGSGGGKHAGAERRSRVFAFALAAIAVAAFVLMLGGSVELFGKQLPTPGRWLGAILPGFSLLRGPSRWGIVAMVALPILAGIGVSIVDRWCRSSWIARGALAGASALTFAWFQIPTQPAWPAPAVGVERYAKIRELPPAGALLEVPWGPGAGSIERASKSVLMSTLHWRPILNGYTGHRPRSYRFLQRIGAQLPSRRAVEQLRRLTQLRYILVDVKAVKPPELRRWNEAARAGLVSLLHNDARTRIYEVAGWENGGELVEALLATEPRATTFDGLPRTPLELDSNAGGLSGDIARKQTTRKHTSATLSIRNGSAQGWPGFDIDTRGLVHVRYSYVPIRTADANESAVLTKLAPVEVDIPPGSVRRVAVQLEAPREPGDYELCLDLVQQLEAGVDGAPRVRALPVAAKRQRVSVTGKRSTSPLAKLIDSAFVEAPAPAACGTRE